jgi:hypothetical protein
MGSFSKEAEVSLGKLFPELEDPENENELRNEGLYVRVNLIQLRNEVETVFESIQYKGCEDFDAIE